MNVTRRKQAIMANSVVEATAGTAFPTPTDPTEGYEVGTPTSVTSNSVTTTIGQRVVLMFSQLRGNAGDPKSNPAFSSIAGTGDFSEIDDSDFTAHEGAVKRDDADEGGVGVYIRSWVATVAGTGAFTVTWADSVWTTVAGAYVVPACNVINSAVDDADNATTSVAPTFSGAPDANDLIFSICCQRTNTAFGVPTDFTSLFDESGATSSRVRGAYRNGGASAVTTWSSLSAFVPEIAASIQLRRT